MRRLLVCVTLVLLSGCMSAEQFEENQKLLEAQQDRMYQVQLRQEAVDKQRLKLGSEQQAAKLASIREKGELEQRLLREKAEEHQAWLDSLSQDARLKYTLAQQQMAHEKELAAKYAAYQWREAENSRQHEAEQRKADRGAAFWRQYSANAATRAAAESTQNLNVRHTYTGNW